MARRAACPLWLPRLSRNVAFGEGRPENLLDVEGEELAVDRAVDNSGCVDAIASQGGDEGERLPMAVRHASLCPRGPQPRKGAMLVLTQVSSMKTSRPGSTRP